MTRFRISLSIGAAALGLVLAAAPAKAQNLVTYVSRWTGDNNSNCGSPTTSCGSIGGALSKTEPGGEIKCLENHNEAAVFISKPITIDCGAPSTSIAGFGGAYAITVNLDEATYPNGVVTLRNLNIDGYLGIGVIAPGSDGIRVIGGGAAVHIENCNIQGFAEQGIDFAPSSGVDLLVTDTIVSNSSGGGILIKPAGTSSAKAVLDHVRVKNNAHGINVEGNASSGKISVTVRDSVMSDNGTFGIKALESGAGSTDAMIEASTAGNNGTNGVIAVGSTAIIRMRDSTSTGNATGLVVSGGGQIVSHGGNVVAGNTTNGAFTGSFAQQ